MYPREFIDEYEISEKTEKEKAIKKEIYNKLEKLMNKEEYKEFTEYLETNGFFDSPASVKYHHNYRTGLLTHSYNTYKRLEWLTDKLELKWDNNRSPFIIGLFHDLCKIDAYEFNHETGEYKHRTTLLPGYGDKIVILLSRFFKLTEEEICCIRYHMGAFETDVWKNYSEAVSKYPNILHTHTADMYASQVDVI